MPEIQLSYKHILDLSTIVIGESGSGKTFVITDLLYHLAGHVDQIMVISPTDLQNQSYSCGLVPLPLIHYKLTGELLDTIWERQEAFGAVYKKVNNVGILRSLFDRIATSEHRGLLVKMEEKLRTAKEESTRANGEDAAKAKIETMEKEYNKIKIMIYKKFIFDSRSKLERQNLTEDEKYTLRYLNFNPRLVMIFDDCTDLLKKFKGHSVIQKIFYQGRWSFITSIIACHTDKALDGELKKNAYVTIFTEESSAGAYYTRTNMGFDKETLIKATEARKIAFTPMKPFQKLIWNRLDRQYYCYTAAKHENFRFGSDALWDYCNKCKKETGAVASGNRFIDKF